jgi:uncharacterized membrane protein
MDALNATPETSPPPKPSPASLAWWRNKLLAGFFVAIPLVVTFIILRFLYNLISGVCDPIVIALVAIYRASIPDFLIISDVNGRETIPGAAFFITIAVILALGLLATNVFGKRLIQLIERGLARIPLVNMIYPLLKQVVESIRDIGSSKENFRNRPVVYVRYPGIQGYFIAFQTGHFIEGGGREMVSVFLPTAPNPITGLVLLIDAQDVIPSGLSLDAAWKIIVSAGFVIPPGFPPIQDQRPRS